MLASEEGLAKLGKSPLDCIEVVGIGHSTGNLYADSDPLQLSTCANAAAKAYAQSGVRADQVGVAEVHDCFTITELLMMEALGFGDGVALVRSGALERGGKLPCNTGGGLVGFGHPVGATGVKQILEIHSQMKGTAGAYQIAGVTLDT